MSDTPDRLAEVKAKEVFRDDGSYPHDWFDEDDKDWLIAEVVRLRAERDAVVEELNRYWRNQGIVR